MLFSFWNNPWTKKVMVGAYGLLVIVGSITICYWTFRVDTNPNVSKVKPEFEEVQEPTSCRTEIERARLEFEADNSPENWIEWANLERGCKDN